MNHSNNLICPSSPAASSFFFIGKKDGGLCPCIDYRSLNNVTVINFFPLPLIPATLEQVDHCNIYTKCDVHITLFVYVKAMNRRLPLSPLEGITNTWSCLTNAPAAFQSFINDVSQDMINDDILIYSLKEHIQYVQKDLQQLLDITFM